MKECIKNNVKNADADVEVSLLSTENTMKFEKQLLKTALMTKNNFI